MQQSTGSVSPAALLMLPHLNVQSTLQGNLTQHKHSNSDDMVRIQHL